MDFLSASIACLKTGGLFIISVSSDDSFVENVKNSILNMPPNHVSCWYNKSLRLRCEVFGVELLMSEHEPLADIHLKLYILTALLKRLGRVLGLGDSKVDSSLRYRFAEKAAALVVKLWAPFRASTCCPPGIRLMPYSENRNMSMLIAF